jgi:serine phosphatase RsbU (regulator of sigma subunit)
MENGQRRVLPLERSPVVIGRSETCELQLAAPEVSRQHCRIVPGPGGWELEDLGSQNGTRVNGQRVARHRLADGDRIEFGAAVVQFEAAGRESRRASRDTVPLDSTLSVSHSIYGLRPDAGADWQREREHLLRLADVVVGLAQTQDWQALLDRIMEAAVALAGAQRGFLILTEGDRFDFQAACNIDRARLASADFAVSRSVVARVVATGAPVRIGDASLDHSLADARSILDLGLKSVLAVPLAVQGRTIGALYLDHAGRAGAFDAAEERLLRLFGHQAAVVIEQARLREAARAQAALQHELDLAARIQRRLLPRELPPLKGAQVHGVTVPATAMSGDYFDLIPRWGGGCDLVVADVAGKGMAASLVMVNARAVLRSVAPQASAPRAVLASLHKILRPDLEARLFLAMTLARWDPKAGALTVVGAGGGPLLVYRARARSVEVVTTGGIVVGAPKPDIKDLLAETPVALGAGDVALLFTDGATEARGPGDAEFGRDRLAAALARHGGKPAPALVEALQAEVRGFVAGRDPHDDLTLVALRRE